MGDPIWRVQLLVWKEAEAETTGQDAGVGEEVVVRRGAGDMPEGKAAHSRWGALSRAPHPQDGPG